MVFDGRQQHPWRHSSWGHFALSLTAEGRGLCDVMSAEPPPKTLGGHEMARAIESFTRWHHGPATPPPFLRDRFVHRLKLPAGVRRERPWSWALSGIVTPVFKDSPFSIERQTLLSLWHETADCVINGANSKEHFEAATFQSQQTPDDALPVESTLDRNVSRLVAKYRTYTGAVTMTPAKDGSLEIGASVADVKEGDAIGFRLQLGATFDQTVALDGKERRLGADDWSVEGVREVAFGNVRMTFNRPARIWWPFRGYNSYTTDHTFPDLTSARLIAETMLDGQNPRTTVGLRTR
jgi:hypothetical protein